MFAIAPVAFYFFLRASVSGPAGAVVTLGGDAHFLHQNAKEGILHGCKGDRVHRMNAQRHGGGLCLGAHLLQAGVAMAGQMFVMLRGEPTGPGLEPGLFGLTPFLNNLVHFFYGKILQHFWLRRSAERGRSSKGHGTLVRREMGNRCWLASAP